MSVMIFCSELSAAGRVTTTSTAPQRLMVPASAVSPTAFFDRRGFAGEIRFVRGGAALGDFAVHGKLRAGLDEQAHPGA